MVGQRNQSQLHQASHLGRCVCVCVGELLLTPALVGQKDPENSFWGVFGGGRYQFWTKTGRCWNTDSEDGCLENVTNGLKCSGTWSSWLHLPTGMKVGVARKRFSHWSLQPLRLVLKGRKTGALRKEKGAAPGSGGSAMPCLN